MPHIPSPEADGDREVYRVLDLALRIGEMLLSNGAGAADVTATMLAVTNACGVRGVTPSITFTELSLNYHPPGHDSFSILQTRSVTHREIDYGDLTAVDALVGDLVAGRTDCDAARRRVARLASTGHGRPRWAVTLGYGVMGAGVALLVGGVPLVVAFAFVSAAGIDRIHRAMTVARYPFFYQQVAGGLFASLLGVAVAASGLDVSPARVVTVGVFMLLAGIGVVGAAQDALTGFPLTANARLLEAMLATAGIIAGVSGGIALGAALGVEMAGMRPSDFAMTPSLLMLLGAAIAAAAFAFASYSPLRALLPTALAGAVGSGVAALVTLAGLGTAWATAVAAVALGALSFAIAARVHVPPLALLVPALVPLLPGLTLYQGLVNLTLGESGAPLVTAAATAIALASGAILGQYVAQPRSRTNRRLEPRLAGPRLVGPLRLAARPVRRVTDRAKGGTQQKS